MAKVIAPLHSAEARGRVSGLIYNTWRGLATCKGFKSPAQPRTSIQMLMRAYAVQMARTWGELNDTQRGLWNDYAVAHPDVDWTGSPKRLSGFNWYVRCNTRILRLAGTPITAPPAENGPDPLATFAAADGVLESVLTWVFANGAANRFWVYSVGPLSQGVQAKREKAVITLAGTASMQTITATNLGVGRYTFWGVTVNIETGLISVYNSDTADITAA
ncbi:unnamed protein product [marine sediment metagenome]|uniref:Uncharacterized protein n=1 Tax=marine sediment metagenome TaxID=412755 RepID=X1G289_9ZZZZ